MTNQPIANRMIALAVAAMLTACQNGEPDRAPANRATAAPAAPATPEPVPAPARSPRSIMQPEVDAPPPEPAPLEPLAVTVRFDNRGAALDDAARGRLDQLAASPQVASGGAIVLRGSSDSHGDDAENRTVSEKRARAAADYLTSKGIDKARMTVIALGEDRPIAPNAHLDGSDNEEGRRRNRRVDITVTPAAAAPDAGQPAAAPTPDASPPDVDR